MMYNEKVIKSTARVLLLVLVYQLILPNVSLALTTGPSQPEVQSFEPVGTTDMVDMFSGDFVYNIPLLDVEGYPVNISYHGGIGMEQEASWVGLGWNINPGEVNRTVRGLPDDFNGVQLSKEFSIKSEKIMRVGIGVGGELFGVGDPALNLSASVGANVNMSNYRGVSVDFNFGGGVNVFHCVSAGINIGVGSQTGADIDYNAGLNLSTSDFISKDQAAGVGISIGSGYNTRSGLKDLNFSVSANVSDQGNNSNIGLINATIPIGVKNYVPVITNQSTMTTISGRIKVGGELFWCQLYGTANAMYSVLSYSDADASRNAYGYLYAQNATDRDIMDFTRDKDGMFNKTMEYLPASNQTYDIYSVNGQGTGGMFRPFRNDFGSVFDPITASGATNTSAGAEAAIGWNFEVGLDGTQSQTDISSGPWQQYRRKFTSKSDGSLYENTYFKQAGELTKVDPGYFSAISGIAPVDGTYSFPLTKPNASYQRDVRGNLFYYFTGTEAQTTGVGVSQSIFSYLDTTGLKPSPNVQTISRVGSNDLQRRGDQISEIVQVQNDGRRYVYGIPAMNNVQKEATFSVDGPTNPTDLAAGLVPYNKGVDDSKSNSKGMDNYYSSTVTPAYAHSYLLTTVLSSDYIDVKGDGPTDDDLGSYTKFNYCLKESDYRWRAPFDNTRAQYNPNFWSEPRDDKGSYLIGSREQWILHSIETKNFVAEFYTSKRNDAIGSTDAIVTSGKYNIAPYNAALSQPASSYKLDSIKLYNKHDRFINGTSAVPIKCVYFVYDYSLCQGVPNFRSGSGTAGKLTLKRIYMSYGNSQRSMISPYQFNYSTFNPSYDQSAKDRWGNYKPNSSTITNYEYPYVNQSDTSNNKYASAWTLSKITLPSGGIIQANYESDDYAYVQDQPAAEMFMISGVGNSTDFSDGNQLYTKNSPNLYLYFKRRTSSETGGSMWDNYYTGLGSFYYNFNVLLTGSDKYEQIKGYANLEDIGVCTDNSAYGYIKLSGTSPTGGGYLNPITYTALNVSRYNLPQIMYPGSDPSASDLENVLAGLKGSFDDLLSFGQNPVSKFVKSGCGQTVNLNKCFVRLSSPGHKKKGGGQRVNSLYFYDSWNALAGGNEQQATYGKTYDYTVSDDTYGTISSGVASYEPMIGGDENPLRNPVRYTVASGSNWPPMDPVDLYQETPIGESLFPSPTVGYRQVTVKSVHSQTGRSSQGIDVYQFYTAKDFPAQVMSTGLNKLEDSYSFGVFSQKNLFAAAEGYTLVFNDMHGKPKSVEHFVYDPKGATNQLISYQTYTYHTSNGQLDNNVNVLIYDPGSNKMVSSTMQLGMESDVTQDTREKNEDTYSINGNVNLNVSTIPILFVPVIIPIPFGFGYTGDYQNRFRSVVTTKVIQQYGILEQVQSYNEGATTTVKNEYYDPNTGQVLVTSVNNEYQDKEYSVNIPAYWGYRSMGPAYMNTGYEDHGSLKIIYANGGTYGVLDIGNRLGNYNVGDELLVNYGGNQTIAWVMGSYAGDTTWVDPTHRVTQGATYCCEPLLLPRYPLNTTGWSLGTSYDSVHIKVIRSGRLNRLSENLENYTMMSNPLNSSGQLKDTLDSVISIKANTYSDINTQLLFHYIPLDTLNPIMMGAINNYRLASEYTYITNRNYNTPSSRTAGLFKATSLWAMSPPPGNICGHPVTDCLSGIFPEVVCSGLLSGIYMYPNPYRDVNWKASRTITKWSPFGKEVEDLDATGIYSTAQYGYNEELPVAVANNAKQGDILAEGFEDYNLLRVNNNLLTLAYSPFNLFSTTALGSSQYNTFNIGGSGISLTKNTAHSGYYSLSVPGTANSSFSGVYRVIIPSTSYYLGAGSYYINRTWLMGPSSKDEYMPFKSDGSKTYILSCWIKPKSSLGIVNATDYTSSLPTNAGVYISPSVIHFTKKSNIIDGWQQFEVTFTGSPTLLLPLNFYVDDVRIYPADANMKAFVYNPSNEKLMATLDENNFATFYEYDQEGNLVRTKKETEKGIMTISESRSNNPKQ